MTIEFAPFRGEVAARADGHDQVSWRDEMAGYLGATSFPGRQDELLAALVRAHAPSRLLWRLGALPREVRFGSLTELCDFVDAHSAAPAPREPM
jgi:hypothetical protein